MRGRENLEDTKHKSLFSLNQIGIYTNKYVRCRYMDISRICHPKNTPTLNYIFVRKRRRDALLRTDAEEVLFPPHQELDARVEDYSMKGAVRSLSCCPYVTSPFGALIRKNTSPLIINHLPRFSLHVKTVKQTGGS